MDRDRAPVRPRHMDAAAPTSRSDPPVQMRYRSFRASPQGEATGPSTWISKVVVDAFETYSRRSDPACTSQNDSLVTAIGSLSTEKVHQAMPACSTFKRGGRT